MADKTKKDLGITNIPVSIEHRDMLNQIKDWERRGQRDALELMIEKRHAELKTIHGGGTEG